MRAFLRRSAAPCAAALIGLSACSPASLLNATVPVGGLTIERDVAYGTLPRETLDIYRPTGSPTGSPTGAPTGAPIGDPIGDPDEAAGLPVVVFFYGGSWNSGSKAMYPFVAATLARTGAIVVVPDYRLYPAVKYPDFLRDCARAVAWVQQNPARTRARPRVHLGHTAGAYNAMMLGLDPVWLGDAGASSARIAGIIGLAGPYDFLPIIDPKIKPIFPDAGPDTQPITYASAQAPPLLLLAGLDDQQVRPRNSIALARRVDDAGGQAILKLYKGLGHVGLVTAIAPAFQWRAPVLNDIVTFLRQTPSPTGFNVPKPASHASRTRPS
jgi:acetyl esterase/lipase